MNLAGAIAMALQRLGEFAHRRLAVAEDDRGCDPLVLDQPAQGLALAALAGLDQELGDILIGARRTRDLDRLRIRKELVGQLLDRRRNRSREKQGLPIRETGSASYQGSGW